MTRISSSLFLALAVSMSGLAAPCSFHRLGAPLDAAAWTSGTIGVADFDGDRATDVLVRDAGGPAVRLLRRDGTIEDVPLPIGGDVRAAAIGDFDGDTRPDLVLVGIGFEAHLALNRLPAGFEVQRLTQADGFAKLFAADFDNDGHLDLALLGGGLPRLLYGDGNGGFPRSLTTGIAGSVPAIVADWNGDGFPDLITAGSGGRFTLHLNQGGNAFAAAGVVEVSGFTNEILAGDLTGDGRPDLIVLTSTTIAIADGTGEGFADPRAITFAQAAADGAVVGDFDRDGINELAFSLADRSEIVDGNVVTFGPELVVSKLTAHGGRNDVWEFPARRSAPLFTGDFDGDGRLDLMAGGAVYRGTGAGGFVTEGRIDPGFSPSLIAAGDFNGDGFSDLAVGSPDSSSVQLYRGRKLGGHAAAGSLPIEGASSLTVADFDMDGRADLVVAVSGELLVHYGVAGEEALFGAPISIAAEGVPLAVTAADINFSNRPDLLFAERLGDRFKVRVLASDFPRGFFPFQEFDAGTLAPGAIALADADVNSVADLIVVAPGQAPTTPPFEHDGTVTAYRRDGTGRVVTQNLIAEGLSPVGAEGGDWDGDGDDDLLIAQQFGPLLILRNDRGLVFTEHTLGASSTLQLLRTDLDRDELPDFLLLQTSESILRLELREGALSESGGVVAGSVPVAMTAGDFNGDGVVDLAIANAGSGSVSVVYGSCGRTRAVGRQ